MPQLHGVDIVDTFAEAFSMSATRLIVTAASAKWAKTAADVFTGNATSVIACDCEAGLERVLEPDETPDGRPGVSLLVFAFSRDALGKAVTARVGQCILTCPTTACYNGIEDCPKEKQIGLGEQLRYFGDGFQISKVVGERRFWRIPVMDGEFLCDHKLGTITGVAGGNLLFCGRNQEETLAATEAAAEAMRSVRNVILPFPGGLVRSGSKVGSKYKGLKASTNDAYCPTLRTLVKTELPEGANAVYEIVIDGLSFDAVQQAMRVGLHAAVKHPGLLQVTAGNYGGKLGKHHLHLRDLL
ncbi:Formyltransferase/hydrolase complex subunit D [Caulifigura coniformis]|uniref:Formylmethanofuran--tetrahydromethanopterin formyltransferase n=1 Tax=Caulifigura coniformis TaxID=2527983 RepID=A0A517SDQ9_9PLAN|nr:formylmethanofuran--tetrahydromethanopterin N-formyltransferase [Caulifigura coniformis]QDT54258.1 Formyltransferase/hydrolase complex subunit D [Caulifigura coniformis]